MRYLLPGKSTQKHLPPFFGSMTTPYELHATRPIKEGAWYGVDNGCFTRPFDPERMSRLLSALALYRSKCLFVTVPDIPWNNGKRVFCAHAALDLFAEWSSHPMFDGWSLAYVAQNGSESLPIPTSASAVFIGGDTDWKMSHHAVSVIRRAQLNGLHVHVGRVNSKKRINYFRALNVDSVDGTGVTFAPDRVTEQLSRWLAQQILL